MEDVIDCLSINDSISDGSDSDDCVAIEPRNEE